MTTFGTGTRSWSRDPGAYQGAWGGGAMVSWGATTPEDWGAIGDGASHPASAILGVRTLAELQAWNEGVFWFATSISDEMDYLAIQAAFYAGGVLRGRPGAQYVIDQTLVLTIGRCQVDMSACVLDWRRMLADSSALNLVTNPSFAGGTGWSNTALTHTDFVFGAGAATFTDPVPGTGASFGQFGQQILIPAGRWRAQVTIAITAGASAGQFGIPYCGIGFFGTGVGTGASSITVSNTRSGTFTGTEDIWVDFEVAEDTTAWLVVTCGNGNVVATAPVLRPFFLNCGVWITRDGTQPGDMPTLHWTGGLFLGPDPDGGVACFLVKSFGGESGRVNIDHVDIGDRGLLDSGGDPWAWSGGVVYSDQAFSCSLSHATVGYCNPAVQFLPGSVNAGEVMRITDCVLFNGGTGLDVRGGGEWAVSGVRINYQRTDYPLINADRGASIMLDQVNLETNPASVELIQLRGGATVDFKSGSILQGGGGTSAAQAYALLEDTTTALLMGRVRIYGVNTASGDFARGAGRLEIDQLIGPNNANLCSMLIRNHWADRFGGSGRIYGSGTASDMGFYGPADGIGMIVGMHADAGTPADRVSITGQVAASVDNAYGHTASHGSVKLLLNAGWSGTGADWRVFYPLRPGKVCFDEFWYAKPTVVAPVARGPYVSANNIRTTAGSAVIEVTEAAAASVGGSGPRPGWTWTCSGAAGVGGIAAGSINGTRTVIARTGTNTFTVAAGAAAASSATGGGAAVTSNFSQTSARIYDRRFFVEIVGQDAYGRPLIGQALYAGETDFDVTCAAQDWTVQRMATWYTEPSIPANPLDRNGNGRAPHWATHMMMVLNIQNLAAIGKPALFVTDYFANA